MAARVTPHPPWPVRHLEFAGIDHAVDPSREWLVTNGLGGFASGVVCGGLTRRYHGWLVAAHPPPLGRYVHVSALRVAARVGANLRWLDHENIAVIAEQSEFVLRSFSLEAGLPIWRYHIGDTIIERRVFMPHMKNTTVVQFRRLSGDATATLICEPVLAVRPLGASLASPLYAMNAQLTSAGLVCATTDVPELRVQVLAEDADWRLTPGAQDSLEFVVERDRGYDCLGLVQRPATVSFALERDRVSSLCLTTNETLPDAAAIETWRTAELDRRRELVAAAGARADAFDAELVLAADQFVIAPVGHAAAVDSPDATARSRSIIAGYHWFTDWGRDTMISLDGLSLVTGRWAEAARILRMFAGHVHEGLIPNLFPEGQRLGLYHTADATLWFFEALARYVRVTGDTTLLNDLLPTLREIVRWHRRGTAFGIAVDAADGLLAQGAEGYALTWMDAKMDGWVVTPRRGKAVEINALWYNALSLMVDWLTAEGAADEAAGLRDAAHQMQASFNRRFWNPQTGWLFDVIDGDEPDDPRCRPNQVLAFSLTHPVLNQAHWPSVLSAIDAHLLTPLGLRTLAPGAPGYQSQYAGDLRARDGAYHQGTVWPWLIGPYVDAVLRTWPDRQDICRTVLQAFAQHLDQACVGSISEIFDADSPYLPRGCVAQAWSVAEVLRAWRRTERAVSA